MYKWNRTDNTQSEKLMADKISGDGDCRVDISYCEPSQSYVGEFTWDNGQEVFCEEINEYFTVYEEPIVIDLNDAKNMQEAEDMADKWLTDNKLG